VVISLRAVTEDCWADLATPAGATIFAGILGPGTSKTWTERRAVTLQLGNPGAVTLTVDGKHRAGLGSQPVTLRLAPGDTTSRTARAAMRRAAAGSAHHQPSHLFRPVPASAAADVAARNGESPAALQVAGLSGHEGKPPVGPLGD
jgi:Domain of unknown function (DUF4115)